MQKKTFKIQELEKRLMLDASLTDLASPAVVTEQDVNAGPEVLDNDVTISGSTTDFDGEALVISTNGGTDDQLSINNEGTGAGQIGFDGTNVTYEGVLVGTVSSDGSNGSNLQIDLNAAATQASIERLIENLTYENASDDPVTSRTVNISMGVLFSEDMDVVIIPFDETPTIDTNTGVTIDEGDTVGITAAQLGINDPDNTDGEVTINITSTVTNGRIELTTNTGVAITSFTLEQLNNGEVQYVHDDTETTADSFDFTVTDGNTITASDTFDITITPVNDPLSEDLNTGTELSRGQEIGIGGREVPAQWGTHVLTRGVGQHGTFESLIDGSNSTQLRITFTTPASNPTGTPGQVLFETGGAGRGIALYLDQNNQLAWHHAEATITPRMVSPLTLAHSTQYAVVIEIDDGANEVRMHYNQGGDFNWYFFGRTPENSTTGRPDYSGGDGTSVGNINGSLGGYNGPRSNNEFQGSIDSPLVLTRFPTGGTTIVNDQLVFDDPDTTTDNIVYTVTTDVLYGTLRNNGVDIGLGDTFTQEDLDNGLITYQHDSSLNGADSFEFSVTDGTTVIAAQTYDITIDVINDAPILDVQPLTVAEDAANGSSIGTIVANDADPGQTLTYSIEGGTGAGIFAIDSATGQVTVANNTTLDYETTTSYTLIVRATDDFSVPDFDEQTFTINVQDVYEGTAPTFTGTGPFNVDENVGNNTVVGTVTTTDLEGDNVTYSIHGGNHNNAFKIDNNGVIRVNGNDKINFEDRSVYNLTIRATDDSPINLFSQTTVTISINDLNDGPSLDIQTIIEEQNNGVRYSVDTGNFYEYRNHNTNFNNAMAQAAARMLNGQGGHLVTITSADENAFVDSIIGNHVWLAASDIANEGEWLWVDGPEAGTQFSQGGNPVNGMYERWAGSEPNNAGRDRAILHTNGWWYDEGNGSNRRYVVEWDNSNYQIINNTSYTIAHDNADASDVALNYSVGFMQSYDDDGDTLEYTIQGGNADGVFDIDINTGEITIADKSNLDASVNDTYTLTIRVQEQGGGLWTEKDITINFDQRFTIAQNNAITVDENASIGIDNTDLQVLDNDTATNELVYTVTGPPANGQILVNGSPSEIFTQADIDGGLLTYAHDGSETLSDSFTFSITDGTETLTNQTFNITVDPVNQGPVVATNTGTTVVEGGNRTITSAMLAATDQDDVNSTLAYTASNLSNGHIEVDGVTQTTFTQDDIDNNRVVFVHDGAEGNGTFDFSIADGGEDSAAPATGTFTLTKTDVNDSPLITTNNGATVQEGGDVTITTADLNVTDPDDSGTGLTYTLSNIENGFIALTSNLSLPVLSFTQDDLDNNRVVFRHGGSENNGRFDVTVEDGGEDSATTDTATFIVTRTPVNDAPVLFVNAGSSINQNSILLLNPFVLNATDSDDAPSGITYTVDATSNGQVEYLANPNVAITSFTQADINNGLVVFRHSGAPTTASFDFTIADGGEDLAGTVSDTFTMNVDNTNDAPVISVNVTQTIDEAASLTLTTAMLNSFDPDDFGDGLTWTASNLSNGHIEVDGVVQNTWTQTQLAAGEVVFIHDDSETTSAGFDISLADGGEDSASPATGTFNINITPVNEAPNLILTDGSPLELNFNDFTIDGYWGGQDAAGGATVSADGTTLTLNGNNWKKIDLNYTLAPNTMLAFDFRSDLTGEVQGLGFDTDTSGNAISGFQLFGTQFWGNANQSFANYDLGDGWVRYEIDIGNYFTGVQNHMVFFNDKDSGPGSMAEFRNVTIYEDADVVRVTEGSTVVITTANLSATDVDDSGTGLTYTVTNVTAGQVELIGDPNVAVTSFTQDDLDNNRVIFRQDGSEGIMAGFDVELADGGEDGVGTQSGRFDIVVDQVDDAPAAATNNGITVNEGSTTTISVAELTTTDPDTAPSNTIFNVTSVPGNGHLALNSNTGTAITSFTLNDLINNRVVYVHDGSETVADSFDFTVSDGTTTLIADTFNIIVTPQNDGATITGDLAATLAEGGSYTFLPADLGALDPDDGASDVTFTVSNVTNGTIEVGGVAQNTFTYQNILDGDVVYIHDGSETTSAGFDISLADGLEHGATADTASFALTITPVNDAPVIATNTGATMNEGAALTITNTMLNEGDPDDSGAGLTYTASNLDNGHIEVDGVMQNTFTQADIDAGDVVFIHDGSETITAGFDLVLADGGEDTVVAAAGTFNITVTPQNDAAVITGDLTATIDEGASYTLTAADLGAVDPDDGNGDVTFTASNLSNGHIEVGGVSQSTFTYQDILNGDVEFIHDGGETTSAGFDISLADGLEHGATADTASFVLTITPVNDAPTDISLSGTNIHESSEIGTVIGTLGTTDSDLPGDTFTYAIKPDPHNKFIIVGNELRLNAAVDYETATQHSVTIQTDDGNGDDGNGGLFSRVFTIDVEDNIAPTEVTLDNNEIEENSAVGKMVGLLGAVDADPNEAMTYTLMANPGDMFAINGDALMVSGVIDFETFQTAEIMVQVEDIDGNTFDQLLTITVMDVFERTNDDFFIPKLEEDTGPRFVNAENTLLSVSQRLDGFIQNEENENIVRDNTTMLINTLLEEDGPILLGNYVPTFEEQGIAFNPADDENAAPAQETFTTVAEALAFIEAMESGSAGGETRGDAEEGDGESKILYNAIEQQFMDVISYHEEKQKKLRDALS